MHEVYSEHLSETERWEAWKRVEADWRSSGKFCRAYCEENGIKFKDFRRFLSAEGKKPARSLPPSTKPRETNSFVTVEIEPSDISYTAAPEPLWLEHKTGFRLQVTCNTDAMLLQSVVKLLGDIA